MSSAAEIRRYFNTAKKDYNLTPRNPVPVHSASMAHIRERHLFIEAETNPRTGKFFPPRDMSGDEFIRQLVRKTLADSHFQKPNPDPTMAGSVLLIREFHNRIGVQYNKEKADLEILTRLCVVADPAKGPDGVKKYRIITAYPISQKMYDCPPWKDWCNSSQRRLLASLD